MGKANLHLQQTSWASPSLSENVPQNLVLVQSLTCVLSQLPERRTLAALSIHCELWTGYKKVSGAAPFLFAASLSCRSCTNRSCTSWTHVLIRACASISIFVVQSFAVSSPLLTRPDTFVAFFSDTDSARTWSLHVQQWSNPLVLLSTWAEWCALFREQGIMMPVSKMITPDAVRSPEGY